VIRPCNGGKMGVNYWASILMCAVFSIASHAQTFTSLASLSDETGASPSALGQRANGILWITTSTEGKVDCGSVFQATLVGKLSRFSNFDCTDGNEPQGLTLGTDGNYYGVTFFGGPGNGGTVFKLTPVGILNVLQNFTLDGSTGSGPVGTLALGPDGNFYGATYSSSSSNTYSGTLFKITPDGTLTTFYTFCLKYGCPDGSQPYSSPILGSDGNFYGTTYGGGAYGGGTVYKITPKGVFTTLYSFGEFAGGPDFPTAPLVQGRDSHFYGTTSQSGANNYGTVYEVTPSGTVTVLHNFDSTDGYFPVGLIQATDGNFYGTTAGIDDEAYGSIYQMAPTGKVTTLHKFDGTDGTTPVMLIQDTNGVLYGVTGGGGDISCRYDPSYGCGTIFSLDVGLRPFVETVPNLGAVGAPVIILGTNLTGVKSVRFNGTAAEFTVKSTSEILTKVPTGATTGTVRVIDGNGTLLNNVRFTVTK
jgi:uncharacterized repeat protein (TIGR03803 family)